MRARALGRGLGPAPPALGGGSCTPLVGLLVWADRSSHLGRGCRVWVHRGGRAGGGGAEPWGHGRGGRGGGERAVLPSPTPAGVWRESLASLSLEMKALSSAAERLICVCDSIRRGRGRMRRAGQREERTGGATQGQELLQAAAGRSLLPPAEENGGSRASAAARTAEEGPPAQTVRRNGRSGEWSRGGSDAGAPTPPADDDGALLCGRGWNDIPSDGS